jgi:hypothetical protein
MGRSGPAAAQKHGPATALLVYSMLTASLLARRFRRPSGGEPRSCTPTSTRRSVVRCMPWPGALSKSSERLRQLDHPRLPAWRSALTAAAALAHSARHACHWSRLPSDPTPTLFLPSRAGRRDVVVRKAQSSVRGAVRSRGAAAVRPGAWHAAAQLLPRRRGGGAQPVRRSTRIRT